MIGISTRNWGTALRDRLHIFLAVAQKNNFTQAAQALYISQPAVSAAIKTLEAEYGLPLFSRAGGHVELTDAGRVLLDYAQQIQALEMRAALEMQEISGIAASGALCVGASTTIAQYILPKVLGRFMSSYPDVTFRLVSQPVPVMSRMLLDGQVDVAIVEGEVKGNEFASRLWLEDEMQLYASRDESLDVVTFEEMLALPFVMREKDCGHYQALQKALTAKGVDIGDLRSVLELGSTEAIKSAVENGLGWAFISEWACRNERSLGLLRQVDVLDFDVAREFYILQTRASENNSLVQKFIAFLHKVAPRLKGP